MAAAPGNSGVTDPEAAGIVVGVVDTNVSGTPVRIVPFVSVTTALIGCVLFGFTVTLVAPEGGTLSWIETGGHVENDPAELPACEMVALMSAAPGDCAVAMPFWSIVTTDAGEAVYPR
jgi:hypothetical protein